MKKSSAVSNSGPLIHLAKIKRLEVLKKLYDGVIIPEEVEVEAVARGKEKGAPDALLIESAIREGWLKVEKFQVEGEFLKAAKVAGLSEAEAKVVDFAYARKMVALIDEDVARVFAWTLGVRVRGTLGILIEAAKLRLIAQDQGLQDLDRLSEVMYMSANVYKSARKALEEM